uniref:Uncharacterized protein n=1 Tax=Avena sativa TaxID=4498 RepID=A0ACD5WIH9_AVESA
MISMVPFSTFAWFNRTLDSHELNNWQLPLLQSASKMGKMSQRRATQTQQKNIGCTWGLIRMFYSRQDPKLILDKKQGSRRHSFSGFSGRGHSRKKSRDLEETDEDGDNRGECSTTKPTGKGLTEGEFSKLKQSRKIPNDEVQRILADLGHDVCLDKSIMQNSKPKIITSPNAAISIASSSASLDPSGSKCMKQAEGDNLEFALSDFLGEVHVSDFLGEVYKYHDEGPSDDCMSNSELCPELKSLINTNMKEVNIPLCDLAYEKNTVCEKKELVVNKHPHNRLVGTSLESRKMLEKNTIVKDAKTSNQHELAVKTQNKESKNIFFWKKDKSSRRHTPERNSQPVNKIVILKPNPKGGFGPTIATATTCLHQQSCTTQAPGYSAAECSTFSVKEVRRRFRIVSGENRKGSPSVHEDDIQRDSCRLRDSVFTIKKDSMQVTPATSKNDVRPPLNSSKQKKTNNASSFYAEAKKHLTEILKEKSHIDKYPSPMVQIPRSLVGMLSHPQCSASSSPGSSPRVKHCIELSPEDKDICTINKAEREESAKEGNRQEEDSGSVECSTIEALDEQADQEGHYKEESKQHGVELDIVCFEETDKPDHSETIRNAQCIPAEQHRYNSLLEITEGAKPGNEHAEILPGSPENVFEKLESQEPETPRPRPSLELMSREENHEKQEQPSPVSVLDPFFHADIESPENKSTIKCELRQDVLRLQYYPDVLSDQGTFWEDRDARLGYIKAVLELSELYTDQNSEVCHLEDELISTCLFQELHQGNQTDDVKLFFDCVCEAITVIQGTHFRNPPSSPFLRHNIPRTPPVGQNLISEINKHIEGHLRYQFLSTLNQLVDTDLKDCSWMDLRSESEEIAGDIWEFLVDELMEDVACDLLI